MKRPDCAKCKHAGFATSRGALRERLPAHQERRECSSTSRSRPGSPETSGGLLGVAILCDMLEFYDYFLIGFVLAFVAGSWKVTYGQSAVILLSSGIGAILGAGFWSWLADRIGRHRVVYRLDHQFFAGDRDSGAHARQWMDFPFCLPILRRSRCRRPLLRDAAAGSGIHALLESAAWSADWSRQPCLWVPGLGAVFGAYLGPSLGWRGLFRAWVCLPAFIVLLVRTWMPESPHWLVRMGRLREARESLAWALQIDPEENSPLPERARETGARSWSELFRYPRSLTVSWIGNLAAQTGIYGLSLWAPTLLVQVLENYAGASGVVDDRLQRQRVCRTRAHSRIFPTRSAAACRAALFGFGAAAFVILAGYLRNAFLGTVSVFWLVLVVAYFFADGGFAIVGPYAAEVWPSRLRASGMGSAYGFGGIGKIIGPLGLALIVGSSNVVKPEASVAKIVPAFIYLGGWYALAGHRVWTVRHGDAKSHDCANRSRAWMN